MATAMNNYLARVKLVQGADLAVVGSTTTE